MEIYDIPHKPTEMELMDLFRPERDEGIKSSVFVEKILGQPLLPYQRAFLDKVYEAKDRGEEVMFIPLTRGH